ncbi:uncharacterized protein LOC112083076 [Eutrema salsugineum]|uniref:uncharacterized protein LOC112083076 n=1 Tax=Eutrema salsugineum TaxID=72664 RepID=UPI000CED6714|nr:uncharacterized protein LOC112083076 [Eutrema salsugineum]
MDIQGGDTTNFWFDTWSDLGRIIDITGPCGIIDMGIPATATIALLTRRRQRRHQNEVLNEIENVLHNQLITLKPGASDIAMWKSKTGSFKSGFSSKDTWLLIRQEAGRISWSSGVWFKHSTPMFSVFSWLAIYDRLSTGDQMQQWNVGANASCVLCNSPLESRTHLFFACSYSAKVWSALIKELLKSSFSVVWQDLVHLISANQPDRNALFLLRYSFQAAIHCIWRERNNRRHGEAPRTARSLIHLIDKLIRCRIQSIRDLGDRRFEDALQLWFATR